MSDRSDTADSAATSTRSPRDRGVGGAIPESGPAPYTLHPTPYLLVLALLAIALRVVALRSDPYPWLDWSAGQLTDEGFYIHNARNVALFGHPRTDGFNNMLLSPLLHYLQVGVFTIAGVGSVPARSISVVCGLLALPIFWATLRRGFGPWVAAIATLLLALDHTNLLFNRMALMDTPATLPAIAAFYAFVRGTDSGERHRRWWLASCGALLGITVISRALCAYLIPVPFLALWYGIRRESAGTAGAFARRSLLWPAMGLAAVLAVYAVTWYLPNRAEIAHMTQAYRVNQIQPHSVRAALTNVQHAFFGDERGISPYLFRHTPVLFVLTLLGILPWAHIAMEYWSNGVMEWCTGRSHHSSTPSLHYSGAVNAQRPTPSASPVVAPNASAELYLVLWLLLAWAVLAVISYSPSRYYVPTYPALAALAALALTRIPAIWSRLSAPAAGAQVLRGALAWFLAFHGIEAVIHTHGVLAPIPTRLLLYGIPTLLAVLAGLLQVRAKPQGGDSGTGQVGPDSELGLGRGRPHPSSFILRPSSLLLLWALINAAWLLHWGRTLAYTQYDASRLLAESLPVGSVLLGDVAPGVCLDNGFRTVTVIPKLCNDQRPVEQFAGAPRYILVLRDSPLKRKFWRKHYPDLVTPERLAMTIPALRWPLEVYAVDRIPDHVGTKR